MQNVLWYSRHTMTDKQRQAVERELNTEINIIHISRRDMNVEQILEFARSNNIALLLVVLPDDMLTRLVNMRDDNMHIWCSDSKMADGEFYFNNWYEVESFAYKRERLDSRTVIQTREHTGRRILWLSKTNLSEQQIEQLRDIYGNNVSIENRDTVELVEECYDIIATNIPLRLFFEKIKPDLSKPEVIVAEYSRYTLDIDINDDTRYVLEHTGWNRILEYSITYRVIGDR